MDHFRFPSLILFQMFLLILQYEYNVASSADTVLRRFQSHAPLCSLHACQCRWSSGEESVTDDDDDSWSSYEKGHGQFPRAAITAICEIDVVNETFSKLRAESPAVRNLILFSSTGNEVALKHGTIEAREDTESPQLTLPWKMVVGNPPFRVLDLSAVQLSCSCENAWLAFWTHSLTKPLVSGALLDSLASRHNRGIPASKRPGHRRLHIINEEPLCPHNCSLTVSELFHLPKRVIFGRNADDSKPRTNESISINGTNYQSPFSRCLPVGETNPLAYFTQKCSLSGLAFDVKKVIQNETEPVLVTCSRGPIIQSVNERAARSVKSRCPSLRLSPFVPSKYDNESEVGDGTDAGITKSMDKNQHWPFVTRCVNKDTVTGEKQMSSRNESGWLLCQDRNDYMPQAALAPYIVAGPPQILHFHEDQQAEQVHYTFYIVGYPSPTFGWHQITDDKWLQPGSIKEFEVILTSRPSVGYYIISGRATFSELSMNCFKGNYDFEVCNIYGCDKRSFHIPRGMPSLMCPPIQSVGRQISLLDTSAGDRFPPSGLSINQDNDQPAGRWTQAPRKKVTLLFYPSSVSTPSYNEEQENWVYIAVPFLVVVAVVAVGVLTTCLFLRLIRGSAAGNQNTYSTKISSSRYKNRPSLTEWELSPLNQQQFEANSSYVDWLHHIKTRVRVFPKSELTTVKELGEGAFGRVLLVKVTFSDEQPNHYVNCENVNENGSGAPKDKAHKRRKTSQASYYAMKLLKNVTAEKLEDLEREAAIMSQLDHPNIVQFFGLSCNNGALALLFEYMENGDLVNFLRNHSPESGNCEDPLEWNDLLIIALQIAKGLEYLAEKHLVHRDLAARNCLVGENMLVKISDFGMTRDIYITDYYKMGSRTLVPLRWLPPESIIYRKFTVESDMWSFGVLAWEIFSYGKIPWYMHSNCEVLQIIQDGKLLEQPLGSPDEVYSDVMLKCWTKLPSDRITANAVRCKLEELLEARTNYCSVYTSSTNIAQCSMDATDA